MEALNTPETKSAPTDVAAAFEEFQRTFEAYKEGNEERVGKLERRSDPLVEQKMQRIDSTLDAQKQVLDELILKGRRPALGREEKHVTAAGLEHSKAFDAYVRHGEASGLKRLEEKALSVGSGADGGYLVPEETEREIGRRLSQVSPLRGIAGSRQVSGNVYRKPFLITLQARPPAGSAKPPRARRPTRRRWQNSPSPPWSSTPCRRRPRPCSTTPP